MIFAKKEHSKPKGCKSFFLGADIGGTNSTFGLFGKKNNKPILIVSFHIKSSQVWNFAEVVKVLLNRINLDYGVKISKACIAAAGPLNEKKDSINVTNSGFSVDKNQLLKIGLKKIILMNDFKAVGYVINVLGKKDIKTIKNGNRVKNAKILVIGAGTGMGKSMLWFDEETDSYVPVPSEAGHADFPADSKEELELVEFLKKHYKTKNVCWEHLLSGRGLSAIYLFLSGKMQNPVWISDNRKKNKHCKETFRIFSKIMGRFAKNFTLDCLPFGGIYIAGGIAIRNQDIFGKDFLEEFMKNTEYSHILKKIPIYLVKNDEVGLLGAGFAASKI